MCEFPRSCTGIVNPRKDIVLPPRLILGIAVLLLNVLQHIYTDSYLSLLN
jgi:hypothetical protein